MRSIKDLILSKDSRAQFFEKYGTVLILLGMIVIMSFLKPEFLTHSNLINIIRQQTPIAIIALGITFAIISGGIDISAGSVVAMCAVVVALCAKVDSAGVPKYPLVITVLICLAVGGLAGTVNGLVISYGNVPPFIATLGMMSAARGVALIISDGRPVTGFSKEFDFIGGGSFLSIPVPLFILAVMFIVAYIILHKTKFGIYVYAIGSSELAAEVSGIKVKRVKTFIYTIVGLFTGVAAVVLASRTLSGQPAVGTGWELNAITAAVIGGSSLSGGIGTITGTFIGALIMGVLTNGMTMLRISPAMQMVVRGAVIVTAVLLDERKHGFRKR